MPSRAVVIGAGLTGMLAAAALSTAVDEVIVLERDDLPAGPEHRKGLPQGRHAHLLMAGGLAAMDGLLPGMDIRRRLLDAGAHEVSLSSGMLARTPEGWLRRWRQEGPRMISCSRALVDWVVRDAALSLGGEEVGRARVEVRRAQAVELLGNAGRVLGVRLSTALRGTGLDVERDAGGDVGLAAGGDVDLAADLVVDASGRGSRILKWLAALGVSAVREKSVDAGLVNATRIYRTPAGAEHFPLTLVHADPYSGRPGRSGMVMPIEGDRWMVSLAGSRGGEPPADPDGFLRHALELPDPIVGRLISGAEPLTDIHVGRGTSNVRHYVEKVRDWPDGLVVLGDALATFNPTYGQGMSVAALEVRAFARELARTGPTAPGLSRRVQRAAARSVDPAWAVAVGQDIWYPNTRGGQPGPADRLVAAYSRRLTRTATSSYRAAAAVWDLSSLTTGPARVLRPLTVLATLNGPLLPPLTEPPLTGSERKILRSLDRTGRDG
ncbi:FAD-dependent oxidoreductase [Streptomyces pseudovenezuelae]|uniref:2-polyprenyl-6-methoxyphenol hydroxylase-like FAD-dependent oxidoreductase n=1 Tax=Streptomyces pseudovenezuelae TaxID=67350 RepID=A0ABT6LGM6_9ACTN|nr:pyridine nucleotide-disulfide oxidoreductase [Streptomyces pseudovenezuelae]MDH6215466.1 2-polyprenyl-6-methoxyphenol hydroxylase-like FAD-dependent oxidoreductase [Streptomyces pseudovenezuelae]